MIYNPIPESIELGLRIGTELFFCFYLEIKISKELVKKWNKKINEN